MTISIRAGICITLGLCLLVGAAAMAQTPAPDPVADFGREWSALDSAINAASLQRQHVVEAAKAVIQAYQKQAVELAYWRQWIDGERAGWAKAKGGKVKP